jgi:DUF3024 family protein
MDENVAVMPEAVKSSAMEAVASFCDEHVPPDLRDLVRLECSLRGNAITIIERRRPWNPDFGPEWSFSKVALLRYESGRGTWSLRSRGSDQRWHTYERVPPNRDVGPLLTEIDADPTGIFWG